MSQICMYTKEELRIQNENQIAFLKNVKSKNLNIALDAILKKYKEKTELYINEAILVFSDFGNTDEVSRYSELLKKYKES